MFNILRFVTTTQFSGIRCLYQPKLGFSSAVTAAAPLLVPAPVLGTITKALFSTTGVCAKIREHFPRPSERKRVKRHGWRTRMSTLSGRKVLMRRILKGNYVLSH